MGFRCLILLVFSVGISSPVFASGEEADSLGCYLDDLVVTATRTPKSIKDVPVVTRVINSDEIRKSNASNIKDLLTEELPGLEFSYAMNQETSLNMGGFGGSAVLFLVDGERLAGETMDNIDYQRLNLNNIGRVEIIKGAASALYGANAVGGVVNLITKQDRESWKVDLDSRYRSEGNEWRVGGNMNFNHKRWNSSTSAQYSTVNTVHLTDPFDTKSKIHNIYGGTTLSLNEKLIFSPSDKLKLRARGGYFHRMSLRETYTDAYNDFSGGLKLNWENLEVSYSYDQYDKSRLINGINIHSHDYSNRQHIFHTIYNHSFKRVTLTGGADYMYDYLDSYQFQGKKIHDQHTADFFLQIDYSPTDWLNLLGSLRDDYFSASVNNAITGRFSAMFKLRPLTVRATYAGGFRAPTLKEMYMDFDMAGISMIYGNPDLKPERSNNFNLSVERNGQLANGAYSMTASAYLNLYKNRITVSEIDLNGLNEEGASYYNESGVKTMGIDVTIKYRSDFGLGVAASGNYLNVMGNTIDSQFSAPRRWSATWKVAYEHRFNRNYQLYAALSGRYLGSPITHYEADGAYSLLKLTLIQTVWRGIEINLTADNLLNYKPKIYYWNSAPTTGISWSIGVSFNLNELYGIS